MCKINDKEVCECVRRFCKGAEPLTKYEYCKIMNHPKLQTDVHQPQKQAGVYIRIL